MAANLRGRGGREEEDLPLLSSTCHRGARREKGRDRISSPCCKGGEKERAEKGSVAGQGSVTSREGKGMHQDEVFAADPLCWIQSLWFICCRLSTTVLDN